MNPLVSLDGAIGWVAVATPLIVLAVVAAAVLWAGKQGREDTEIEFDSRENRWAREASPAGSEPARVADAGLDRGAEKLDKREYRAAIAAAIAEAEHAGERGHLAELYLSLAVLEREAGDEAAAAALLRKSVLLASETGNAIVHAKGRLELGDQAHGTGDLTTACEHWQMARALFDQLELAAQKAEAEARMQRNGCPTDWVLTDF